MIARALSVRRLAPLGALALVAGAAVAQAAGGGAAKPQAPPAAPAPRPAVPGISGVPYAPLEPGRPPVVVLSPGVPAAVEVRPCRPRDRSPAARTPPSDALRNAFGILRRERREEDALPARALAALKAQRLEPVDPQSARREEDALPARGLAALKAQRLGPVDPQSARLLRAYGAARAWAVPVPDVDAAFPFGCIRGAAPREGLAVVAVGGAPAGGGGALRDLQRGQAPVTAAPCAGADRNMLGISGIVPDGVEAVFVTAADGSATRADVRDNGYAFVLPRPRRPEPRYVVWTGNDGTPHVQPLPIVFVGGRGGRCARIDLPPRVTPDPWGSSCAPFASRSVFAFPRQRSRSRRAEAARARARARARRSAPAAKRPRRPARRLPVAPLRPVPAIVGPCAAAVPAPLVAVPPHLPSVASARPAPPEPRPSRRP